MNGSVNGLHIILTHSQPSHRRTTGSTGSYKNNGSPKQRCDAASKLRIPLPNIHGSERGGPRYLGVVPPPSNGPTRNPSGKGIAWTQHKSGPATVNLPIPQRAKYNHDTSRLYPDLLRAQSLTTNALLLRPPLELHLVNPWPQRSHRNVSPHHPSRIGRPSKHTAAYDVGPVYISDETVIASCIKSS